MKKKIIALFFAVAAFGQLNWPAPFYGSAVKAAVVVFGGQASVYGYQVYNPNASACYLDFFTAAPTLGTTVPVMTVAVGATSAQNAPPAGLMLSSATGVWVAGVTATGGGTGCGTGMPTTIFYRL